MLEQHNIHIWLVNQWKDIFIKKIDKNIISIKDLTVTGLDLEEALHSIEKSWGILSNYQNLKEIYSFKDYGEYCTGYILLISMDQEMINLLHDNYSGEFISYQELDLHLKRYIKNDMTKEVIYGLMAYLDGNS